MKMHVIRLAALAFVMLVAASAGAVADQRGDRLEVFAAGASGSSAPIQTLDFPVAVRDVAVNAHGDIYVTDAEHDRIERFARGSSDTKPSGAIAGSATEISAPSAIAFDSRGDLYVANEGSSGAGAGIVDFTAGATGDAAPARTICGTQTTLRDPIDVAVDSRGAMYVVDAPNRNVLVFAPGAAGDQPPARLLSIAGFTARAIAVGPDDDVYVYASDGPKGAEEIATFPQGRATTDPERTPITGAGVNGTNWISVDGAGYLHVISPGHIYTFAPDAAGKAAPVGALDVDFFLSNCCARIAAGADGKLYVYLTAFHWAA